jgi:competence protein ComEC
VKADVNGSGTGWFELWQWSAAHDSNQRSCVLQIEANGERLLLTGDIDTAAERACWRVRWRCRPTGCKRRTMAAAVRLPWRCFGLEAHSVLISVGRAIRSGIRTRWCWRAIASKGCASTTARSTAPFICLGAFEAPWLMRQQRRFWR